ncbi:hypothetical protein E2L07_20085 [Halalkalibacterium halodurans]|uniref:hypothetical protein n=1 Tax=Halalkalibacterium halodurans TaxID=86665 RepID=UPI001068BFD8|nr:hypothetical protein [Halalkalibacterium halodurans]TES45895.1 hypothetical protein E2L07_20085 [Halalkalibacterium halodurans]
MKNQIDRTQEGEEIDLTQEGEEIEPIIIATPTNEEKEKVSEKIQKLIRKVTKERPKKEIKEKKNKVLSYTPDVLPFIDIDDFGNIECKYGYLYIYQIESVDISTLNEIDAERIILSRTKFFRSYTDDIKEVMLNFPVNTEPQQQYIKLKMSKTTNRSHLKHLKRKLFQLEYLEKNRVNRECYLFIYGSDLEVLENNKQSARRLFKTSAPLIEVPNYKKVSILYKLNNPNSKII